MVTSVILKGKSVQDAQLTAQTLVAAYAEPKNLVASRNAFEKSVSFP